MSVSVARRRYRSARLQEEQLKNSTEAGSGSSDLRAPSKAVLFIACCVGARRSRVDWAQVAQARQCEPAAAFQLGSSALQISDLLFPGKALQLLVGEKVKPFFIHPFSIDQHECSRLVSLRLPLTPVRQDGEVIIIYELRQHRGDASMAPRPH